MKTLLLREAALAVIRLLESDDGTTTRSTLEKQPRGDVVARRMTDEALRYVARMYRVAVITGAPPTKSVGELLGMTPSTASRWVMAARVRGFLGMAEPGRTGEFPDRRAIEKSLIDIERSLREPRLG
ncbi:MAG: hypothetical protein Q8K63_06125 [Acidimicrobiales bacterium]|nr:hypothetical protein [Acidimicrobiales bacterium]